MLLVEVELAGETGSLFRGRGVGVGLKKAERCEALIGLSEREKGLVYVGSNCMSDIIYEMRFQE